jgi:hypothetical protein
MKMEIKYQPSHAVVRTLYGRTYVFYPFATTEPDACPVHTYEGAQRIGIGTLPFLMYRDTKPANAHPDSLAIFESLTGYKSKRINADGVNAIKSGYNTTTGDNT